MPDPTITADALDENLDLSAVGVGLAIASATAMLEGGDSTKAIQAALTAWPEEISDHALVIGQRVTLAIAQTFNIPPDRLGGLAAAILSPPDESTDNAAPTGGATP